MLREGETEYSYTEINNHMHLNQLSLSLSIRPQDFGLGQTLSPPACCQDFRSLSPMILRSQTQIRWSKSLGRLAFRTKARNESFCTIHKFDQVSKIALLLSHFDAHFYLLILIHLHDYVFILMKEFKVFQSVSNCCLRNPNLPFNNQWSFWQIQGWLCSAFDGIMQRSQQDPDTQERANKR